jgi:hypothetical protein
MENILYKPSVISHILQGLILFYIFILLLLDEQNMNKLIILLLLSVAIGIHSITHLGLEIYYKYNPIELLKMG